MYTQVFAFLLCATVNTSMAGGTDDHYGDAMVERFVRAYDGDTITVDVIGWPDIIGKEIGVRVRGVDTPEIRAKCPQEKLGAMAARDYVRKLLTKADVIELERIDRGKYFRILADVIVDGQNLAELLIQNDLGRPYDGGKRQGWCE